jgi:hypothetical protein
MAACSEGAGKAVQMPVRQVNIAEAHAEKQARRDADHTPFIRLYLFKMRHSCGKL